MFNTLPFQFFLKLSNDSFVRIIRKIWAMTGNTRFTGFIVEIVQISDLAMFCLNVECQNRRLRHCRKC